MPEFYLRLDDDFTFTQVLQRLWAVYRQLLTPQGMAMEPFTMSWKGREVRFESKHDFEIWVKGFTDAIMAVRNGAKP